MRLKFPLISDAADYERHFNDDAWRQAAAVICARHNLPAASLRRAPQGENIIFFAGRRFVVKIFAPFRGQHLREAAALEFAHGKLGIETPEVIHTGQLEGWPYLVMTRLAGLPLKEMWSRLEAREQLEIVSQLGVALQRLHAHTAPLSEFDHDWDSFIERQARQSVERQRACGANPEWLESLPAYISARLPLLPPPDKPVLLHGDVHPGNLLLAETHGRWRISALFDFGDSLCGFHEYEFVAPGVLMVQGRRDLQRELLLAYGYREAELGLSLRARLMLLTVLYECSDLRKYALRLSPDALLADLGRLRIPR